MRKKKGILTVLTTGITQKDIFTQLYFSFTMKHELLKIQTE